jgi:hypothetical protein
MGPLQPRAASKRRNTYLTPLIRKSCARVSAGRCSGPTQLAWRDIPRARSASRRALRAAARGFCESCTARSARVAALNAAVIVVMSAVISVIPTAAAAIMLMIVISQHRCRSRYAAARSAHSILLHCDHLRFPHHPQTGWIIVTKRRQLTPRAAQPDAGCQHLTRAGVLKPVANLRIGDDSPGGRSPTWREMTCLNDS